MRTKGGQARINSVLAAGRDKSQSLITVTVVHAGNLALIARLVGEEGEEECAQMKFDDRKLSKTHLPNRTKMGSSAPVKLRQNWKSFMDTRAAVRKSSKWIVL